LATAPHADSGCYLGSLCWPDRHYSLVYPDLFEYHLFYNDTLDNPIHGNIPHLVLEILGWLWMAKIYTRKAKVLPTLKAIEYKNMDLVAIIWLISVWKFIHVVRGFATPDFITRSTYA
jgi:hypothetical protein